MKPKSDKARFTILEHDHPFLHWDLLMQKEETLVSWRLLEKPVPGKWIASEKLPDHRMLYLDYEGPVSGDRGQVTQFCTGYFWMITDTSFSAESADHQHFKLDDCFLGVSAICRFYDTEQPEWRFE